MTMYSRWTFKSFSTTFILTIWLPTHYAVYSWRGAPDRLSKQAKTRRRKTLVIPRPAWPLVLYQNNLAFCSMVKGVFFWRLLPSNLPTYHPTYLFILILDKYFCLIFNVALAPTIIFIRLIRFIVCLFCYLLSINKISWIEIFYICLYVVNRLLL